MKETEVDQFIFSHKVHTVQLLILTEEDEAFMKESVRLSLSLSLRFPHDRSPEPISYPDLVANYSHDRASVLVPCFVVKN